VQDLELNSRHLRKLSNLERLVNLKVMPLLYCFTGTNVLALLELNSRHLRKLSYLERLVNLKVIPLSAN
jgi:hypothetical protein